MRKSYLLYTWAIVLLSAVVFQGCKKIDGIDNQYEIKTPYSLYFADSAGVLYNTNNGTTSNLLVFDADGYTSRAVGVSGPNLIWVKRNAHLTENNGNNFNPTYFFVNPYSTNQSVMLVAKDQGRVYLCSTEYRGVEYSESNGSLGSWVQDHNWDDAIDTSGNSPLISSLTELTNGTMIGYDIQHHRIFSKDNKAAKWVEKIANYDWPDTLGSFTLAHYNNTVVSIDLTGTWGAWYSNDNGVNWTRYNGLPQTALYVAESPYNQTLLIGTNYYGVYRLQNGSFVASNDGVDINSNVRGFAAKENIFKNDANKQYIYMTANTGLYRSEDMGHNWIKVKAGNFTSIY